MGKTERIAYFDYLRIFASFLIIILHVASYSWYVADVNSGSWIILNIYKSLTDHAVLLFVMISGALFLGREIAIKNLYLKHVLRMVCAFVFWSFIYALIANYAFGIKSVLIITLTSHYHLWFIPMIAGLYICLPVLRLFTKTDRILKYFLLLSFIFAFFIPQVLGIMSDFGSETIREYGSLISDRVEESGVRLVCGYSFYFMTGYYVHKTEINKKWRKIIYILGIAGIAVTMAMTTLQSRMGGVAIDNYHENFNIAVMFTTIATFVFFKYNIGRNCKGNIPRMVLLLSESSFAAYLIHALVIEEAEVILGINALSITPVAAVPLISVGVFVISFAIGILLKKIPFFNKYFV